MNEKQIKKEKYVHTIEYGEQEKRLNLKAWYKAHDYARIINPTHLGLLDEKSRELVERIDAIRREMKASKSATKDDDILDNAIAEVFETTTTAPSSAVTRSLSQEHKENTPDTQ